MSERVHQQYARCVDLLRIDHADARTDGLAETA